MNVADFSCVLFLAPKCLDTPNSDNNEEDRWKLKKFGFWFFCCLICDIFFFMSEIFLWIMFFVMYHVSHMFCNINIIIFPRDLSFYLTISQWKRQIGILNNWLVSFSNAAISFYFSVEGLLNILLIFPCHIIFLIIIVLHLVLYGISKTF